uniref:Cadherin domain-containing protein n=1 Tax=Astatotilapia calliptera TaxID=8154 RepID=A0A3P8P7H7_ASTCA
SAMPTCVPGFESELLVFRVSREHLRPGMRLGKVGFTDCTERTVILFSTDDSHFTVKADGTLTVNREVVLHKGHQNFFIHSWDSHGHKTTVPVSVVHPEHHHVAHTNFNIQHHSTEMDSINNTENATEPQVPILQFPKSGGGLRRRKRAWLIPPLNVPENKRGTYPLKVVWIRSSDDKLKKIFYSITGPGADLHPVNRFTMDRETGNLYVTQPLDREETARYLFEAHAVDDGAGQAEDPMEIKVNVIDQNDNKPYFTTDYKENVAEATAIGTEVVKVEAKDDDEPGTDNSELRYRILNQDPPLPTDNMFEINPVTGSIRVTGSGLDREKYPQYTLTVQAADLAGEGLSGQTKVILTVTDSNDNAPVFTQKSYTATVDENKKDVVVVRMIVTDEDEPQTPAWNAKFKIVSGDPDGLFTVKTGTNKQEGILSTAKELDFERASKHTLLVSVENEIPFAPGVSVVTSTATVVVNVRDVNEAPIFDPKEILVVKPEDLAVDEVVVQYTASDPDTARKQTVSYKILIDPAGWLNVDKDTGLIKVYTSMDREGIFVTNYRYTATIGAYDNGRSRTLWCSSQQPAPYPWNTWIGFGWLLCAKRCARCSALLLLVLLVTKQRKREKKEPLLLDDGVRDNVYYYDEEGGGEDDQVFFLR